MKSSISYILAFFCIVVAYSCSKTEPMSLQTSSADNGIATILRTSLVGLYTFDGDVLDHSNYGNNIAFNSATATTGKDGLPNTAYAFDGKSSYMTIPNSTSLNGQHGITLAATIKVAGFYDGICHGNRIIMKGYRDQSQGTYFLGFDDAAYYNYQGCYMPVMEDKQTFYGNYGNTQYNSIGTRDSTIYVKKNRWYTIIYTVDTSRVGKLYINGELKATASNTSADFTPNSDDLFIGRAPYPSFPYWFDGVIDEIRIYNRAFELQTIHEISKQMQQ